MWSPLRVLMWESVKCSNSLLPGSTAPMADTRNFINMVLAFMPIEYVNNAIVLTNVSTCQLKKIPPFWPMVTK